MAYKIKLDVFEGPFDLLLFLIRKHEIDIYDIPIHDIAQQFLEYVELMIAVTPILCFKERFLKGRLVQGTLYY